MLCHAHIGLLLACTTHSYCPRTTHRSTSRLSWPLPCGAGCATPLQPSRSVSLDYGSRPATLLRPAAATLLFVPPPLLRSCHPLLVPPPPLLRSLRAAARRSPSSLLPGDALAGHAADEPACILSFKSSPRFVFAVADKR